MQGVQAHSFTVLGSVLPVQRDNLPYYGRQRKISSYQPAEGRKTDLYIIPLIS
jgi:hypothetical protein